MFRANNFDKLLDKATSNLRLDPDWPTILQICDLIRQNDCTPKYAIAGLKKKLYSQNPHQAMFALLTLESIVKNCGSGMHDEVASKAFCEMLRDLVKTTQHENLRNKILELIQAWAFAFRNNPKYRAVQDTVNILKAECYKFPTLKESDAMFSADTAPEWADGEVCHRCRVAFSLMVRRHHCRACGQVFCQQCSAKTSTLPKFGIEKEVRVCDACYDKVSRPPTSTAKLEIVDTSNDYGPTQPQKRPPGGKTAEELQEEEELQLALALSQSEAEQKEKERRSRSHINPPAPQHPTVSPSPSSVSASPEHSTTTNAELSRYLDRGYWEQRLSRDTASAPAAPASIASSEPNYPDQDYAKPAANKANEDDAEDKEIEDFCSSLKSQVEIFVNRMKSNSSRGRSIANDTSVQTLFMNITAMHSNLLRYIQLQDDKRVYLESLQDKVTQIRDSRAALDTLRAEHAARLAAAAEAQERQRQMQMAAKLQAMRKKKHEYLQYQRQLALQRVQEQEREMQMRQEQQKHQYMMSSGGGYYMPGVSMQQYQAGFNQPVYANPQQYHQMMPQATTDGSLPMSGQPQLSQAMGVNPMATAAQSMPSMAQGYPLSTPSAVAISQANINTQPNMPGNVRQPLPQQMPMMMHQMRLSSQTGQLGQNGYAGQNVPQQNGQPKPQGQPQGQPMMPPISGAQQSMAQQQMLATNPMLNMQMQNMRMPINQHPSMYGNPQLAQLPSQILPGQPMSLPSQQMLQNQGMPGQGPMQGFIPPSSQNLPQGPQAPQSQLPQQQQLTQGQPMSIPNQPMPPQSGPMSMPIMQGQPLHSQSQNMQQNQQMMQQGQHLPQQGQMPPQGQQMAPQGQQIPPQGQQMPHQGQQVPPQGQQIPPQGQQMHGQPMPQGQPFQQTQMPQAPNQGPPIQGQQMHPQQMQQGQHPPQQMTQGHQMPQGPPMPQNIPGQPVKMPQQNFNPQQPPSQTGSTNVKSEHNNNTAELISFD